MNPLKIATVAILFVLVPASAWAADAIVTEAVIAAPVSEVWKAWTTKPGIESWMVARTSIDLRIGGAWRTSYNKDSNLEDDTTIQHTILALDPERMLAYRTEKPPKDFPFPAIVNTWTVVYFEPVGPSQTRVVARMNGYRDDPQSLQMRAFFEKGNKTTLESLVRKFK